MTAKQQLKRIYTLSKAIERRRWEIARLRELAVDISGVDLSRERVVGGRRADSLADNAARIVDLEAGLAEFEGEYMYLFKWAKRTIGRLPNEMHREILAKRYLFFEEWEVIMEDLAYSRRQIFRIHGVALQEIEKMALHGT